MSRSRSLAVALALALTSCSRSDAGSGSGSPPAVGGTGGGISGVYTSVDTDEIQLEFRSGGTVVFKQGAFKQGGGQGSGATYTVDGEKVIVDFGSQQITFIRDGDCLTDALHVFGKMCKGGQAGAAANVSTRDVPVAHEGTYVASNADGEFTIQFQPGNRFTLSAQPPGGAARSQEAKFKQEGDTLYATLEDSTPMTLKWVNRTYESTAFGLPMKFVKK